MGPKVSAQVNTIFFFKQRFFSADPHCYLTFSWIELQMLLRCCLTLSFPMHSFFTVFWCFQEVEKDCIGNKWVNTYKHHHTATLFVFTKFVPKSRPGAMYVVSWWSIFHFYLHFHYDLSYKYRCICSFAYFLEYVLLFLDDNVDEQCA